MSDPSSPDPYQAPAWLPPELAASERPSGRARRPGWFVTICVIAIALGATGFLHSLYALAGLTIGDPLDAIMRMQSQQPDPAEFQELNERFEKDLADIANRYYAALLPLALARLALTACLVIGGIGCLGGKSTARTLLIGTMAAALVFEICDTVVQSLVLSEMAQPLRDFGQALDGQDAAANAPKLGEFAMTIFHAGILCVVYTCQVAKMAFYLGGFLYLRRASLDPLFQRLPDAARP